MAAAALALAEAEAEADADAEAEEEAEAEAEAVAVVEAVADGGGPNGYRPAGMQQNRSSPVSGRWEPMKKVFAAYCAGMSIRVKSPPTKNEQPSTRPTFAGPKQTAMNAPRKLYNAAR